MTTLNETAELYQNYDSAFGECQRMFWALGTALVERGKE